MSAKLKQLLYDNHQKDFKQQYDIIEEAFIQWKGEKHQTDDVLLIGMKV